MKPTRDNTFNPHSRATVMERGRFISSVQAAINSRMSTRTGGLMVADSVQL